MNFKQLTEVDKELVKLTYSREDVYEDYTY